MSKGKTSHPALKWDPRLRTNEDHLEELCKKLNVNNPGDRLALSIVYANLIQVASTAGPGRPILVRGVSGKTNPRLLAMLSRLIEFGYLKGIRH